jgi:hypothetical protein
VDAGKAPQSLREVPAGALDLADAQNPLIKYLVADGDVGTSTGWVDNLRGSFSLKQKDKVAVKPHLAIRDGHWRGKAEFRRAECRTHITSPTSR